MNQYRPSPLRHLNRLILAGMLFAPLAQADTLYVLSEKAPLLEAPSFTAATLDQLPRGASLTLVLEDGSWLQVEHGSRMAWVSRWLVGNSPPQQKTSVLTDAEPTEEVRRRASSVTTAGAIRGLSEGETELGGDPADYEELGYLESLRPGPEALETFQAPLAENTP